MVVLMLFRKVRDTPRSTHGMEAPRQSLNASLPWPETALSLGRTLTDNGLPPHPFFPVCPSPEPPLVAHPSGGGPWFHCPACHQAGDLIEFAALLWGLSPSAAVSLLVKRGVLLPSKDLTPKRRAAYGRDYPDYRRRLHMLWQRA